MDTIFDRTTPYDGAARARGSTASVTRGALSGHLMRAVLPCLSARGVATGACHKPAMPCVWSEHAMPALHLMWVEAFLPREGSHHAPSGHVASPDPCLSSEWDLEHVLP
jgi:hypothetical protein